MGTVEILVLILLIIPIPFVLYDAWRDYLVDKEVGFAIGYSLVGLFPLINHFIIFVLLFTKEWDEDTSGFIGYKVKLNGAQKCNDCGITSRNWQIANYKSKPECPQCNSTRIGSRSCDSKKEFPFAPKITEFQAIKRIINENKINNIKHSLKETERIDNELQAYEQLQLKKLQELGARANEIKAELAQKGAS